MNFSKEETIRNFVAANNSFDIESMLNFLHPEIHFKNITAGIIDAQTNGKAEFKALAIQSAGLFKEREQKIISHKETDDKADVEIQFHAVLSVDLPNGLKSGDCLDMRGKSEYIFKEELIFSIVDAS